MAKNEVNFTKSTLEQAQAPAGAKRFYLYDEKESGLVLQVTPAGKKSFQLYRKHNGQPIRVTIGTYPELTVEQARKKARQVKVDLNNGINPNDEARAIREELTFSELFHRWLEQFAKPHKRSWADDLRRYQNYMEQSFGSKRLSWFDAARVREWHHKLTTRAKQRGPAATITPGTANRALALLKTIFSQAAPELNNPCLSVKMFKEVSRERFLQPDEMKRLFDALECEETGEDFRDYIYLSLFTAARRNNVLGMRWNDVDLDAALWTIPGETSKNGSIMRVPLADAALEILQRRKASATSIFVFPSNSTAGHYNTPTKAWKSLLNRAGLHDLRLHDLRRSCGSVMANQGISLAVIGGALGHKHHSSTAVYARLQVSTVRDALEQATRAMLATKDRSEKVVPLKKVG
ncbi:MAG: tyrosine-type recombinase/integrase [Desulfuromonadaceae bacterium]|nr:tyrosine-type recombinase/integrase [Desulfuromonadaceae bacterium]